MIYGVKSDLWQGMRSEERKKKGMHEFVASMSDLCIL